MPDRGGVPASDSSDEAGNYGVERILAERMKGERMHYLVKWQGYSEEECTWEPPENFNDPQTLQEWQERLDIGDTLDEDGITALQKRMNAYIDSQYEEDRLGVSKRRRLMNGRKRRESSSPSSNSDDTPMKSQRPQVSNTSTSNSLVDDRTAHFKSPETAASPSLLPRLKVQPRRQSNPKKSEPGNIPMGPARSTPTEPLQNARRLPIQQYDNNICSKMWYLRQRRHRRFQILRNAPQTTEPERDSRHYSTEIVIQNPFAKKVCRTYPGWS